MSGSRFIQTSFNAGEWSALLEGRVDLEKYGSACFLLENFLIDPRGPISFCPGFRYVAGTKLNDSWLIPFEFSTTQAYQIEFGHEFIRFYRNRAQILDGATPYEIASPYAAADVPDIRFCQSADVLYLFHPGYAPRKLSRTGHTAWVLSVINFRPAAMSEQGFTPATTLTLSATTGTGVVFTASGATFLSGDVGRVITSGVGRAAITSFTSSTVVTCDIIDDFASVGPIAAQSWSVLGSPYGEITPSDKSPVGSIVTLSSTGDAEAFTNLISNGSSYWTASTSGTKEYRLLNTAPVYSAVKPSHVYINGVQCVEGSIGTLGITQWAWGDNDALGYNTIYVRLADGNSPDYYSSTETYVKRSSVTSAADLFRSADVGKYIRIHSGLLRITNYTSETSVEAEILKELTAVTATVNWTLESDVWNETNGYPTCGTFYEERLVLAGSPSYPETIWGSCVGDYENFTPGVDDDLAFEATLAGRQVNVIRWIEAREYLIVGTAGGEWRLGPEDTGSPLTPLNIVAKQEGTYGSAGIAPITVTGSTLFVQRAGRKVREFTYEWQSEGYQAPDITVLAEHVTLSGLAGIVYQQEPLSIVWGWMTDGSLVSLSYMRDQGVVGWVRHPRTGKVKSMAVIPGDGEDEVWAVIEREINGVTVQYVEILESLFTDTAEEFRANKGANAFFVDSGSTYNGDEVTTITGADHLEGETVVVLADGNVVPDKVVTGGQFTLPYPASVVHYGLGYNAAMSPMRLDTQLRNGTAQGRLKKIHEIMIRVYNSALFKAGRDDEHLNDCYDQERILTFGEPYPLFTGDLRIQLDSDWERNCRPIIVQNRPLPLTVTALIMEVSIS